ncbi:MAG: prolipoprotein diacylglyceryl transferase [Deltaproteobacteria bacterium]|nr:prolipoprotein diacylglyceryl transferase [Candidatus Zymogenaceae bacterium]
MHPVLFSIDGLTIYTYGLCMSVAFLVSFGWGLLEVKRRGLSVETGIDLTFWALISGLFFSRLAYVLVNLSFFIANPLRTVMIWEGGLVWYGAFFGAIAAGAIFFRAHKLNGWLWADIAAPFFALGQGIGRIGCFMAGCCYGRPTDLCWGVVFTKSEIAPLGVPLHPAQLYAVVANLLLFLFLFQRRRRSNFDGEQILAYVILYAVLRSILEVFRGDPRGFWLGGTVSTSQMIAVVAVMGAAGLYYYLKSRGKTSRTEREAGTESGS